MLIYIIINQELLFTRQTNISERPKLASWTSYQNLYTCFSIFNETSILNTRFFMTHC